MAEVIFWTAAGLVAYVYVVYPLALTVLARLWPRPSRSDARCEPTVTLVVAAWNEEDVIGEKIANALALDYPEEKRDILVVSDGSDDRTDEIVRSTRAGRVKVLALKERSGKATALERGVPRAAGEVVVLTDANTMLRRDALRKLVRHFADPVVGAVTGDVRLVDRKKGYAEPEGAYYRYERHLQACESTVATVVGVDGGLYAIRKVLFRAPPPDTILDDFVISMEIAKRGYRIIYEPEAIAEEDAAPDVRQEFRRKVRVLSGAWQCVKRGEGIPAARAGALFVLFVSHKLLRWLVPVFLLAMLGAATVLAGESALYAAALVAQVGFYGLAAAGAAGAADASPVFSVPYYFCLVNAAAAIGLAKGLFDLESVRWKKVGRTPLEGGEGPPRSAESLPEVAHP